MGKRNGKSAAESALDLAHELPPGEDSPDSASTTAGLAADGVDTGTEMQKLRAERDTLLDRLARAQAEFENARRRSVREQQEFRDYALADAVKALLPVVDNFERALRAKIAGSLPVSNREQRSHSSFAMTVATRRLLLSNMLWLSSTRTTIYSVLRKQI